MTPFGHIAVSYLIGKCDGRLSVLPTIAAGLLPDIDFVALPRPSFKAIHRTATHSVFFTILAATVGYLLVTKSRRNVGLSLLAGATGHLVCDSLQESGVALLWPLSMRRFTANDAGSKTSPRRKRNLWGWEFIKSALPGILVKGMIQEIPIYLVLQPHFTR